MENSIAKCDVMQQHSLGAAGLSALSLMGCNDKKETKVVNNKLSPFYLPPAEPLQPGPVGLNIRTWVRSSQTNMQFSNVETAVAPRQMGPAPHLHKDLDEIMLVLEGTATVMVDGKVDEIVAGVWHWRPRGIV